MEGTPGTGLHIEVTNRLSPRASGAAGGSGRPRASGGPGRPGALGGSGGSQVGLIGLAERASLAGGSIEHGVTPTGDFRLAAWLPWPKGAR